MASSLVCCFCGFHGSSLTINLTKDGVTAGFLLPFELGVVLVVVDLVVILWLVYDTSSRERKKKKVVQYCSRACAARWVAQLWS